MAMPAAQNGASLSRARRSRTYVYAFPPPPPPPPPLFFLLADADDDSSALMISSQTSGNFEDSVDDFADADAMDTLPEPPAHPPQLFPGPAQSVSAAIIYYFNRIYYIYIMYCGSK